MTNECDKLKPVELTVLMPVRNEGINLRIMLKMLRAVVEVPCEVLVVHDTAEDDSLEVVEAMQENYPHLRSIHNKMGPGVINAIRSGVAAAQGQRILLFAADEVGPVLAIEDMLCLMDQGCDFVSCTRYANGGRRLGGSVVGGFLSRRANRLFRLLTGTRFTDCTTGIKMFRRDVFEKLDLQARPVGWAVAFEMAIKAQYVGLQLGEVPIISIDRLYGGKSTFKLGPWCKEYFRWFVWGMRHLRKGRQAMPNVKLVEPQMSCR
jgi:dolichol-phosphate mannosyltransferase